MAPTLDTGLRICEEYGIYYELVETGLPEAPLALHIRRRNVGSFTPEQARVFLNGVATFWASTETRPTMPAQSARAQIPNEWRVEGENMTPRELTCYVSAVFDGYINPEED